MLSALAVLSLCGRDKELPEPSTQLDSAKTQEREQNVYSGTVDKRGGSGRGRTVGRLPVAFLWACGASLVLGVPPFLALLGPDVSQEHIVLEDVT